MASQKETVFKRKVIKDLKTIPFCWFLKTQERARRGVPDILASICGQFVALELKEKDCVATPLQMEVLDRIVESGGFGFVVNKENWASIFEELKDLSNENAE